MSKFHERFKSLRDSAGESQVKIAEKLGMTPQALSYYANGREPNYEILIAISKLYNVSTDYLLGVSDYKTVENYAVSEIVPLSDGAVDSIKSCPAALQPTLDSLLSDPNLEEFLLELMTYIYSLGNAGTSEATNLLSTRILESGSSKTTPEIARILAERLTPAIQQVALVNALKALADSMVEKAGSSELKDG